MLPSIFKSTLKVATLPARFAIRQSTIRIQTLTNLYANVNSLDAELRRAQEESLTNIRSVLSLAEKSLPAGLSNMSPDERTLAAEQSLQQGEQHLLSALGDLYRACRFLTARDARIIEHERL